VAGSRKAPFVAVRTDIRKEERVLVIADIAGYNRHEAMGRLLDLWAWCTDRWLQDAPEDCEGYAVSEAVVARFLGPHGVRAILGDNCNELALGELRPDGLVYLRGTSETVSRLRALRRSSSAGGEARVGGVAPRRKRGRFVAKQTNAPAGHQPATSGPPAAPDLLTIQPPARTSVYPQTTNHRPEEEDLSLAPPAPRPEVQTDFTRVVDDFDQRYRNRHGTKPTWGPKQGKIVKSLLAQHSADEVIRRNGILFTAPPAFLEGGAIDIGTLAQHFDKLVEPQQRRMAFNARARDPTVGRVEPSRPDQYPDGDQPI
jgi:hypothetical protein